MKKIVVPSGMARAAWDAMDEHARIHGPAVGCVVGSMCSLDCGLSAALQWLSENPMVPTIKEANTLIEGAFIEPFVYGRPNDEMPGQNVIINRAQSGGPRYSREQEIFAEWQRRMFLQGEPEVTEEVKDLLQVLPSDGSLADPWKRF